MGDLSHHGGNMKYGICVCGLNGCGKTTLARALAEALKFRHMDAEDYYFRESANPYSNARTQEEVRKLLLEDIGSSPRFVYSCVKGDMGDQINSMYDLIVYLEVPAEIRGIRIRQRAAEKFGDRVLPGGDLHEQEEKFFDFAAGRNSAPIEAWIKNMPCRVIRLDGREPVRKNIEKILAVM